MGADRGQCQTQHRTWGTSGRAAMSAHWLGLLPSGFQSGGGQCDDECETEHAGHSVYDETQHGSFPLRDGAR